MGTSERIGARVFLVGDSDMVVLGEVVHSFLVVDPGFNYLDRGVLCWGALDRWGVAFYVEVVFIFVVVDSFMVWVMGRWPRVCWLREWSICHCFDDGAIVWGFIDLVFETDVGYVVIDHKSFLGGVDQVIVRVSIYAG